MSDDIERRLQATLQHAYANAPELQARLDAAGVRPDDIRSVADLARIPIRTKDEIIRLQQEDPPFGGLLAAPSDQIRHIYFSPGPLYEPDIAGEDAAVDVGMLAFEWSAFTADDVVLNSLSYHLVPAGMLVDKALTEMGCTVIPGGVGNSDLQVKMMHELGVTAYAGTPSFLLRLLERAEEMGLEVGRDLKLRKMFGTAEPFPADLRQIFVERYKLSVANCYATAELGLLALDTAGQLAIRLLPEPIIQVVDPDTGQSVEAGAAGEVVVTNFSHGYPLIRFGTGDLAIHVDPAPGQSRQDQRAIILVGRRGEAVKVRGMFVHPNQLRFALDQVVAIQSFQGVVSRAGGQDRFVLRIAPAEKTAVEQDQAALVEQIKQSVRNACRVRLDEVEFVGSGDIPADAPTVIDQRDWH
ncbi:MAG: AMP-binding protein [Candidatus Promineifilaceae bacterium]|nr:AMP-binding protein [Candidatus Promineifilaceae bacterium]